MTKHFVAVLLLAGCCLAQTTDRREITVSSSILSKYVGTYQMAPGVNMMITLAGDQLTSQMSGQGKVPLFAESETMFFPKSGQCRDRIRHG
jgi:hypothetical protein